MLINFFKGHPTRPLLPTKQIAAAYQRVLLDSDYLSYDNDPLNQHPLTYGTDPGNFDVRTAIASWNNRVFNTDKSSAQNINLTGGASYGIANILASTTSPEVTRRAFVVSPTYFLINSTFVDVGLGDKLTAVRETPGAHYEIDLQHLEQQLERYSQGLELGAGEINIVSDPLRPARKLYRFVIYLVPTFSNPGGLTYSVATRQRLLELARRYDMLIISDDVYELLDYSGASHPLPRFNYLDIATLPAHKTFGNTISNATFSKIIAPGLRVGWQETATPLLVEQLAVTGANKSGGTPGQLASLVVKDLLDTGALDTIVRDFNKVYQARGKKILQSLAQHLPQSTVVYGGKGGYFLWVEIQGGSDFDHSRVVKLLQEKHGVVLAGGEHFEVVGDIQNWGKNSVRLSLSYLTEDEIEKGIKTWGEVLKQEHPELYV
ncbi:PLP-dependent transferase [Suhomyces tanzawaensis NRRL Y-17324]|uniref:PLP-dependent transferase n=1 Tax=Suhomyces tanzawaensis NRRL Y-17324 TaxID=984487 RepID=A0A1E4SH86_9ASCO|nr:PLP-dependent transferase [Suhomyces tanzawaensis NRRL Y-17324]ODV78868.1 PLP-dependent transferase [Suhomyces tanzawaensis NRRL Y-17324]